MQLGKKVPKRKCLGCREMKEKHQVVRVVATATESIVTIAIDYTGKANGRGAYVCKNIACIEHAKKAKGLERSFKRAIPKHIYDELVAVCTSVAN